MPNDVTEQATVLIIDDVPDNLGLLGQILGRQYKVRVIAHPNRALEDIRFNPPDLILLDILMPVMDGFELAARLKKDPLISHIPIIFISALDDLESKTRAFAVGGVDYITKPFQEREVLTRVEIHLSLQRMKTEIEHVKSELERQNQALQQGMQEIQLLQDQLHQQAIYDPLTGVFNRGYLIETLPKELAQAERSGQPLCLVLFEVDQFKDISDHHGYQTSDLVLTTLVHSILNCVRRGDAFCRYGGEEFVVLMPSISAEHAYQRSEEWRQTVEALEITLDGQPVKATISLGIACSQDTGSSADIILSSARQALQQARVAGGNCSVIWKTG